MPFPLLCLDPERDNSHDRERRGIRSSQAPSQPHYPMVRSPGKSTALLTTFARPTCCTVITSHTLPDDNPRDILGGIEAFVSVSVNLVQESRIRAHGQELECGDPCVCVASKLIGGRSTCPIKSGMAWGVGR